MKFNLNFDDGKSLAYIKGGIYDKEIIYLSDKDQKENKKKVDIDDMALLVENLYKNMKGRLSFKKLEQLQDAIMTKERPINRELANHYDEALKIIQGSKGKEILLDEDSNLYPMWDIKSERQVFMITGMSGSGKSTYTSQLMDSYHKQYKRNKVYIFSNKDDDPALDKHKFAVRIPISEDLVEDPIHLDEFRNSLVIFDDIEGNPSRIVNKEMDRLRDLILQQGRSYKCSFVYISHLANNYKQTRTILNECNAVTVFPAMTTRYALKYLLEKYFGFEKKDINKLVGLNSRWVTIYKAPVMVMYSKGCYLLN